MESALARFVGTADEGQLRVQLELAAQRAETLEARPTPPSSPSPLEVPQNVHRMLRLLALERLDSGPQRGLD